ncbi:MAG: hypothetical protein HC785_20980, partial [Calothrix sp. CSU_2_0]|nr:hypothetical protein [Calothrix sp. CSU_2_0]
LMLALNIVSFGVVRNQPESPGISCQLVSHCVAGVPPVVASGEGQLNLFPTSFFELG